MIFHRDVMNDDRPTGAGVVRVEIPQDDAEGRDCRRLANDEVKVGNYDIARRRLADADGASYRRSIHVDSCATTRCGSDRRHWAATCKFDRLRNADGSRPRAHTRRNDDTITV